MRTTLESELRNDGTKRLTLLKAYRIVHNLDTNAICDRAGISRSYLTRVEQGATPSAEIAARLVEVLTNVEAVRSAHTPATQAKAEMMEVARRHIEHSKAVHPEFATGVIQEIHLLYPNRYQATSGA